MRLPDRDRLAGLRFPIGGEALVYGIIEFACGVIRDVEQRCVGFDLEGDTKRQQQSSEEKRRSGVKRFEAHLSSP